MGTGFGGEATRQEPEEVPATAFDHVVGLAVPLVQLVVSQIRMEMDAFGHVAVLQQTPATPYKALTAFLLPPSKEMRARTYARILAGKV